jgi:hypothetical protein
MLLPPLVALVLGMLAAWVFSGFARRGEQVEKRA